MPWMPWAGQERAGTIEFLDAAVVQAATGDGAQYAVIDGGRIAGTVGFHRVDWRNSAGSIGYWLAADAQGRGLMTRAVAACLDHAFGAWDLHRIEIRAAPENAPQPRRARAARVRAGGHPARGRAPRRPLRRPRRLRDAGRRLARAPSIASWPWARPSRPSRRSWRSGSAASSCSSSPPRPAAPTATSTSRPRARSRASACSTSTPSPTSTSSAAGPRPWPICARTGASR